MGVGTKYEALQGEGWLSDYIWKIQLLDQSMNLLSNEGSLVVLREFVLLGLEAKLPAVVHHFL